MRKREVKKGILLFTLLIFIIFSLTNVSAGNVIVKGGLMSLEDVNATEFVNATIDVCVIGGNCLSDALTSYTETDPYWSANYSTFLTHMTWATAMNGTLFKTSQWNATNTSYALGSNLTIQNNSVTNYANFLNTSNNNYIVSYVGSVNTSMNNYILFNNNSVRNYILYVNSTNGAGSGSYNDAWINATFYNTSQIVAINTSMKNYADFLNTSNNNYIVSYVGTQNTSMKNYVDNTFNTTRNNYIAVVNTSMKNYADFLNTSNNNYIVSYVGTQNTSMNNYILFNNNSVRNYILWVNSTNSGGGGGGSGNLTGTGTAWYIPMWNGTTSLNNSIIYQNGINIGIGTTSPDAKLKIYGNGSESLLNVSDGGVQTFIITSNGRVGIGTASPGDSLEVSGGLKGIIIDNGFYSARDSSENIVRLMGMDGTDMLLGPVEDTSADMKIYTGGGYKHVFSSDGKVGIGTLSPDQKLKVNGSANITGDIYYGGSLNSYSPLRFGKDSERGYTTFCVHDAQGYQTLIYFDEGKLVTEPNSAYCQNYVEKDVQRRILESMLSESE